MLVTPSGIVIDVSPEQLENAQSPMLVTPSGIVTDVRPEQLSNAYSPMLVTGKPPKVCGIATSPSVEVGILSTVALPSDTV